MFRRSLVFLAVLYPFAVFAEPAYLECQILDKGTQKPQRFSVKLDEASGKITHTYDDGSAFNAEGFFAANTITYQSVTIEQGIKFTLKYEVDRTTLKYTQFGILEIADPAMAAKIGKPPTTTERVGKCSVVKAGARKI